MPILPIPVTAITDRARFQVTAYDPDGDELSFRFGNVEEMGGIVRSKEDAFPWSANPTTVEAYDAATGELDAKYGVQVSNATPVLPLRKNCFSKKNSLG